MNVLIIGHGRAGQRHAALLNKLDIVPGIYDPPRYEDQRPYTLRSQLSGMDLAVICTPPDLHPAQARTCLDAGLRVLVEKPLCGWGQLGEARSLCGREDAGRAVMALNYRWHPVVRELKEGKGETWDLDPTTNWTAHSAQVRRDLPPWGLLLDHVSHTVDLFRFLGAELDPRFAYQDRTTASVYGKVAGTRSATFLISDWADHVHRDEDGDPLKEAYISGPFSPLNRPKVEVPADWRTAEAMYLAMWADVLAWVRGEAGNPCPLAEGLATQEVLERARRLLP